MNLCRRLLVNNRSSYEKDNPSNLPIRTFLRLFFPKCP